MFTTPMKLVLAAIVTALIGLGFYLLDWQERFQELARLDQTLAERKVRLESSKLAVKALPSITAELEKLEHQLAQIISSQPDEDPRVFVANYLADLERLVLGQRETSGDGSLSITSITPTADAKKEGENGLATRIFQMQMTSRYATLADFLDELSQLKLDRLVTINRITLTPQGSTDGRPPVLSVTIPVTAYLRQGN